MAAVCSIGGIPKADHKSAHSRAADVAAMVYRLRSRSGEDPAPAIWGLRQALLYEALYESARTEQPGESPIRIVPKAFADACAPAN